MIVVRFNSLDFELMRIYKRENLEEKRKEKKRVKGGKNRFQLTSNILMIKRNIAIN